MPQLLTDGVREYIWGPEGLPLEQVAYSTGLKSFFVHDQIGNTRVLMNEASTVVASFTYAAYGGLVQSTGAVTAGTPVRDGGGDTDSETRFVYLVNRYYDPATGQFTTSMGHEIH